LLTFSAIFLFFARYTTVHIFVASFIVKPICPPFPGGAPFLLRNNFK
jgi:hypothetical protein